MDISIESHDTLTESGFWKSLELVVRSSNHIDMIPGDITVNAIEVLLVARTRKLQRFEQQPTPFVRKL